MEFALVAPLFVLLIFGLLEYGRMVMVQQVITNASREGARRAILDKSTGSEVKELVENYLVSASITGAEVDLDPLEPSDAGSGDPVRVTVKINFDQVSWLPSPMYLGARTMTASTVMRRETVD